MRDRKAGSGPALSDLAGLEGKEVCRIEVLGPQGFGGRARERGGG